MLEKYKIVIILLLILNGIFILAIEYLRANEQKNASEKAYLIKLYVRALHALQLYNEELSNYTLSEREFIGKLIEIIKKNEKHYENTELLTFINNYIVDFKERVDKTNDLTTNITSEVNEIVKTIDEQKNENDNR